MDTCQDYVDQKRQRGQAPREVRLDRQPWSWGRLQGRRAKHLLVSRSLTMRRALDHGCLVTGIYNLADACCPQRHERKYGRVGTVLLILPAPTSRLDPVLWGARAKRTTSRDEAIHFGATRLPVSCPRRRRMAADSESRVAALENEKRRLLESWQREREKCASQQGTWTKDLCIR